MRVAIYHHLPPGGALRLLHEFVRRSAAQHEYDLYTVDPGRLDPFAYAHGRVEQHDLIPYVARSFPYPVLPAATGKAVGCTAWTLTAPYWMDRVQRRIATDINARGYDAAIVHPCRITHTPAVMRYLRVPTLHYMHEYRRRSFESGYQAPDSLTPLHRRVVIAGLERVLRRGDRTAAAAADRIVCNSTYTAECIRRAYGRNAVVCHPGVDSDVFNLAGSEPAPGGSVVSVGGLEPTKNQALVVQALALLPASGRPALDLVYERCDESYRAEVETLAASAGVELRLHAGVSDGDLAELYGTAAATVVTAFLEPFGLVPLESMACGTPVVAVREAGYRETVEHGVNGFLVDRSPAAVADGLSRVLSGGLGKSRQDIRGTIVPRWGWDDAVKLQLEQLAVTADRSHR